jgi:hypothetical protein
MAKAAYNSCVFLNVPLDKRYRRTLLRALVFAIYDCGFVARCALEDEDTGEVRINKIYKLMSESKYGIHDISRTSLDREYRLPRFNMPLELGIFLGARYFGQGKHTAKRLLVLDLDRYRYHIFCSDIAGQDIRSHENQVALAIHSVRNWLRNAPDRKGSMFPGATRICDRYTRFQKQLPKLCATFSLDKNNLEFNDYATLVAGWLKANP